MVVKFLVYLNRLVFVMGIQVIDVLLLFFSCPVDSTTLGPISLEQGFRADPDHLPDAGQNPDGSPYYQITGKCPAARWSTYDGVTSKRDVYIRCRVKLCTTSAEVETCKNV